MNTAPVNGAVAVRMGAREQASGLANIIGQYLDQLLGDSAQKRQEASELRGRLGLMARQGDVAVTVVFADDGIAIEEGLREPDAVVGGDVEFLMQVLAGQANPAWEFLRRTITIDPRTRHPHFAYRAYRLMRLPGVHVWSGASRPPVAVVTVALAAIGVAVAVCYFRCRAAGGDDG